MTADQPRGRRHSIRLPGYDYTQPSAYFVTICTQGGECLFDDPGLRRVVETVWQGLPQHFPRLSPDAWVVMPNHFHGIAILSDANAVDATAVGAMHSTASSPSHRAFPLRQYSPSKDPDGNASPPRTPSGAPAGSLGAIIGSFKSITSRRINQIRKTPGVLVWQRNYYEHIIRSERALNAIRQYITDNPARWHLDRYNTQAGGSDPLATELWRLPKEEAS